MLRILNRQDGAVAVFVALLTTVLVGFTAVVVDGGFLAMTKAQLQTAADAGALAGAQAMLKDCTAGSQANASNDAVTYAHNSPGKATDKVTVAVQAADPSATVKVTVSRTVPSFFAFIFNIDSSTVTATATATVGPAGSVPWAPPFAIAAPQNIDYDQTYTMRMYNSKKPFGQYEFDYVDVVFKNPTSSRTYLNMVQKGYQNTVSTSTTMYYYSPSSGGQAAVDAFYQRTVDDKNTDPANVTPGEGRVMLIPIIDAIPSRNTSTYSTDGLQIRGFIAFFLTKVNKAYGTSFYAQGKFLKGYNVGSGGVASNGADFGTRTVTLTK